MAKKNPGYLLLFSSLVLPLFFGFPVAAQNDATIQMQQDYIKKYKDIALREMAEFKIPASITLAQGIIETGSGKSRLAKEANNHFGIKCHVGWEGESVKMDDDAPNECFRKYKNAEESFKDHSFFLSQRPRYASLFDLELTDYKGWAHGLKKAGYATNPKYGDLLIKIIEDHELYELDKLDVKNKDVISIENEVPKSKNRKYEAFGVNKNDRKIFTNNGKKFIFARKGDDFQKIASDFSIYTYQIWKYNDLDKKDKIAEGQMIYIEKKKNDASKPHHVVEEGETMYSISQLYGMKLSQLHKKNRMKKGAEARPGQVLWLQEKKPEK